jgi:hypothetical protein
MTITIHGPGPRIITVSKVAGTNLSGQRVVRPQADGTVVYADPGDPVGFGAGPWWLTTGAVSSGATADLLAEGETTEPSWSWTPGARLFLGTNGALSTTPPAVPARMLQVAVAVAGTTIYFDPQVPIETV